jgi:NAD+--asparagine ADP-ribosyltransferase
MSKVERVKLARSLEKEGCTTEEIAKKLLKAGYSGRDGGGEYSYGAIRAMLKRKPRKDAGVPRKKSTNHIQRMRGAVQILKTEDIQPAEKVALALLLLEA